MTSPQPLAGVTPPPLFVALGGRFQRTVVFCAPSSSANVSRHRALARRRVLTVRRHEARTSPRCPPPPRGGLGGDKITHDEREMSLKKHSLSVPKVPSGSR